MTQGCEPSQCSRHGEVMEKSAISWSKLTEIHDRIIRLEDKIDKDRNEHVASSSRVEEKIDRMLLDHDGRIRDIEKRMYSYEQSRGKFFGYLGIYATLLTAAVGILPYILDHLRH